jgi:hypothetical protein
MTARMRAMLVRRRSNIAFEPLGEQALSLRSCQIRFYRTSTAAAEKGKDIGPAILTEAMSFLCPKSQIKVDRTVADTPSEPSQKNPINATKQLRELKSSAAL